MGVEVHGRCDLEYIGMDFIKWYIGGQATKACRVYAVELRKNSEKAWSGKEMTTKATISAIRDTLTGSLQCANIE